MIAKLFKSIFVVSIFYFIFYIPSYAADYKADYQVEYFLTESQNNLNANVRFNIAITNFRSDIYVNKFAISFPKSFIIHNLTVSDDNGQITPQIATDEAKTKIEMDFSRPKVGRGSTNNFYLEFLQENLFKVNGNIWEVILPTVEGREDSVYKVIVNLPAGSAKKISIAKPRPDYISGNQIIWNNPSVKTIYAVFGDNQIYQVQLSYHLKNPKLVPVYTDIALPPDTLYQKIYLQSINPKPSLVSQDEDGNYLARYFLKPAEVKIVDLEATVELFVKPRDEVLPVIGSYFDNQKRYLLSQQKYWQIDDLEKIKTISSVAEIYNFVTKTLKYNYNRVGNDNKRLGANIALNKPEQAVCVEFTDLFVAAAREKGIFSREIEGYGFSQDPQIRPLSLVSDILHSWPEFYDEKLQLWIPVDPTWENTSGIDYFSSFDLNHIVFAIHGKKSDYPLSAGMYKIEDSRDILVKATTQKPKEIINLQSKLMAAPKTIVDNQKYKAKIVIENSGNVYLWNIPVGLTGKNLNFSINKTTIPILAPLEKKEISFEFFSFQKNKKIPAEIEVSIEGEKVIKESLTIIPYYYNLGIKIAIIVGIFAVGTIFLRSYHRWYRKTNNRH